jgi:hypothetical protein
MRNRSQYILRQIGGIGILETATNSKSMDHRRINLNEPCPGFRVGCVSNTKQQA